MIFQPIVRSAGRSFPRVRPAIVSTTVDTERNVTEAEVLIRKSATGDSSHHADGLAAGGRGTSTFPESRLTLNFSRLGYGGKALFSYQRRERLACAASCSM